mgnify:CR=1 FL=1|jgi:hypothetical protein
MFKKFIQNKFENVQFRELEDFLSRMRHMDSDVLGGPAAITSIWADALQEQYGWDVYYPHVVTAQHVDAVLKIGSQVRNLQKQGAEGNMRAVGGLVWSHTLRASLNLKLTGGVREIWSHIERGFPYADEAAASMMLGTINHIGRFPDGFTPQVK